MDSTIVATEKSTHKVEVFTLGELRKHEGADTLSLISIGETDYSYVGKTDDWKGRVGQNVAWIPPDSLVNVSYPEFAFLAADAKYDENGNKGGQYARIKAKKLRGVVSYGLMVPFDGPICDDAAEILGVRHYEAPLDGGGKGNVSGEDAAPPSGNFPKYDVDAFLKYGRNVFVEGEPVFVTEKIHGANARYVFTNKTDDSGHTEGMINCGSRNLWKKEFSSPPKLSLDELKARIGDDVKAQEVFDRAVTNFKPKRSLWWVALESTPQLRKFCEENPGYAVYGEVFGQVQNLKYGAKNGEVWFRAFDILAPDGRWLDADEFLQICRTNGIPHVPVLHESLPFDFEELVSLAQGSSLIEGANHIKEGVVVRPVKERWDKRLGRVNLKIINPKYLEL